MIKKILKALGLKAEKNEATLPQDETIMALLKDIQASDSVSNEMKEYSTRLVLIYLPAITKAYNSCYLVSDKLTKSRINRTTKDIYKDILSQIESCLIDIQHGAVFEDDLCNPFLNCLLEFESNLDSRIPS